MVGQWSRRMSAKRCISDVASRWHNSAKGHGPKFCCRKISLFCDVAITTFHAPADALAVELCGDLVAERKMVGVEPVVVKANAPAT